MPDKNDPTQNNNEELSEQLLRTIRYTGQTNDRVMETQSAVLSIAEKIVESNKNQEKIAKMRFFLFAIPIAFMVIFYAKQWYDANNVNNFEGGYVAQVKITGPIREGSATSGADSVIPSLQNAFKDEKALGVLIRISTPGGSPGQSEAIRDEILRLQSVYPDKKVAVIGEEMMTSGGYWIASAAPEIYAMRTTYIGSIGVISASFNYADLVNALGVKRIVTTSGKSKSKLDPYKEINPKDLEKSRELMNGIHQDFITIVKESRGERLQGSDEILFNGDYWRGPEALDYGLVDGLTTVTRLLIDEFGTENVVDYSRKPGFFEKIVPNVTISFGEHQTPYQAIEQDF